MSWPTDGEPRHVTASISGGGIDVGERTTGNSPTEHYVFDRARCHRVVATFTLGLGNGGNNRITADQIAVDCCEALNQ